jgi:hypothetical protein
LPFPPKISRQPDMFPVKPKGIQMLGMAKARETVSQKITLPMQGAIVMSALALIVGIVALFVAVAAHAH